MVVSKTSVVGAEAQLSRKWLDSCLAIGNNEEILSFLFSPLCVQFLLHLIKLLSQSASFLTFLLFSPCPIGEESE